MLYSRWVYINTRLTSEIFYLALWEGAKFASSRDPWAQTARPAAWRNNCSCYCTHHQQSDC